MYSGTAAESSGRTRDHAPSAPTSRSVVTVLPSAKVTSWRPPPRARTPLTLWPQRTVPAGSESSRMRRSSPRCTSGRPPLPSSGSSSRTVPSGVENPRRLAALQDEAAELLGQAGRLEGGLAVVVVDVEHPALGARGRRGLRLVDRGRDAVDVQDAGQDESAEAGADDRDVGAVMVAPWLSRAPGVDLSSGMSFQSLERRSRSCQDARVASRTRKADAARRRRSPGSASSRPPSSCSTRRARAG